MGFSGMRDKSSSQMQDLKVGEYNLKKRNQCKHNGAVHFADNLSYF